MGSSPHLLVVVGVRVSRATLREQRVVGTRVVEFQACPEHGVLHTSFCGTCGHAAMGMQREEQTTTTIEALIEEAAEAVGIKQRYGESAVIHETSQESPDCVVGIEVPQVQGKNRHERLCLIAVDGFDAEVLALVQRVTAPLNSTQAPEIHVIASISC
jgi:hypothetical protein